MLGVYITFCLIGLLVYLAHRFFTKNFGYWKSQGVKFVKPVPVFGSVASQFMMKDHVSEWAQKVYKEYEGEPFVGFYQGRLPALMVMDPQLIKNIFVKDFSNFMDHSFHVIFNLKKQSFFKFLHLDK
jgi:cytochrome P450 family 6